MAVKFGKAFGMKLTVFNTSPNKRKDMGFNACVIVVESSHTHGNIHEHMNALTPHEVKMCLQAPIDFSAANGDSLSQDLSKIY